MATKAARLGRVVANTALVEKGVMANSPATAWLPQTPNGHQKQAYCNAHYRQLQEQNPAKTSRKEKRAAKADVKTESKRTAKAHIAELLQDMLLKARESGKQSILKRDQEQYRST